MAIAEYTTLLIALAALVASVVSVLEMQRQRRNDSRPVLVVIEKRLKSTDESTPLVLYLVNMGNAVAMNIQASVTGAPGTGRLPERLQSEVAAGRRMELLRGHKTPCIGAVQVNATYEDLNGIQYRTTYQPGRGTHAHDFRRVRRFLS